MRFAAPLALLLLFLLPAATYIGWPARGPGRGREVFSLVLRLLILTCLIFSLSGLEIVRAATNLAVVFLIDSSDSMQPSARALAEEYVRQALAGMGPDDQAAVVVFGGDALVERPMSSSQSLGPLTSTPHTGSTDIAAAIRLGTALYPPGAARRMVILSDGLDTAGRASEAASLAAASGVQLLAVPLSADPGPEASITGVDIPARLRQGERFDLRLTVLATRGLKATVRVLAGGEVLYSSQLDLRPGEQSFSLPLQAGEPGFYTYAVQIEPQADGFYQNNELAAFTQVEGPPAVLLVELPPGEQTAPGAGPRPDEGAQLTAALQAAQIRVQIARPSELPSDPAGVAPYAGVILVDVPARSLSQRQMETLQGYVRDLGGGLVVVGGPTSYGVGGYYHTPLEDTLPVEMQIKDELRHPTLTMLFIIDHSGSMSEASGGVPKLELAKEAAIRSIDLLFPTDRVGVIAFDSTAQWIVPIRGLDDPDSIKNAIAGLRPGGGTDILAGLQAMAAALPSDPAQVKHVILLTDGGADPTGIPELVERLHNQYGITLTTIGVGQDAAAFLPDLARLGGGRYHFTADPSTIPSIFTEETSLATRSYIIEERFFPRLAVPSPILAGLDEIPPLEGYIGTSSKSAAQTILVSHLEDPILATWQYGLGKAVAFTSDATGRWAKEWLGWPGFTTFWSQAVRYALRQPSNDLIETRVETEGDLNRLVVEARAASGAYLNNYRLEARLVAPGGETQTVPLEQVAPGRYAGPFAPVEPGAYLIGITGQPEGANGDNVSANSGWVLSYSPEYRRLEADPQALTRLASAAGGSLAPEQPARVFAHDLPAVRTGHPAWPLLLALASLLLPLDIAVRRLIITPGELQRGLAHLAEGLHRSLRPAAQGISGPAAPRSGRLEALMQARQRARRGEKPQEETYMPDASEPGERPTEGPIGPPVRRPTGRTSSQLDQAPAGRAGAPPEEDRQTAPAPQEKAGSEAAPDELAPAKEAPAEPASTAARLLAKKRRKRP